MKLEVIGCLCDEKIRDGLWVTTANMTLLDNGREIASIAPGFVLDYASFPDFAYRYFRVRDEWYDVPALFHDYLVRHRKQLGISLIKCHAYFRALLEMYDCPVGLRNMMYYSVYCVNWAIAGDGKGQIGIKLTDADIYKILQLCREKVRL